mmetsp:Transcript_71327/g.126040  ORF Transcript_71327/g.126040 Transcript_71327/m.126040 type:complete len:168 (-) Transcript_71327:59-562(-)
MAHCRCTAREQQLWRTAHFWTVLSQWIFCASGTDWVGRLVLDKPDAEDCTNKSATGDSLWVEYKVFIDDRPQGPGKKLEFKLGSAPVPGWDEHLLDMCIDEERELTIPPSTHKHQNIGMKETVPRDAVLQFHIRLLDINGMQRTESYKRQKEQSGRTRQASLSPAEL